LKSSFISKDLDQDNSQSLNWRQMLGSKLAIRGFEIKAIWTFPPAKIGGTTKPWIFESKMSNRWDTFVIFGVPPLK